MLTTNLILPVLAYFTTYSYAPPVKRAETPFNTATCNYSFQTTSIGQSMANFEVHIGRPYINGAGCESIRQSLLEKLPNDIDNYRCLDDDSPESTFISFTTSSDEGSRLKAIEGLAKAYPMIASFQDERICAVPGA